MKKLMLAALSLTLLASTAYSDPGKGGDRQGRPGSKERMAKMQEMLGLSEDQVLKMREIRENGGSRQDMRAILTDDQKAIMDERRAEHQAKRGEQRGQGKPGRGKAAPPESAPIDTADETL